MIWRRRLALVAAILLQPAAALAGEGPVRARLDWQSSPGCLDQQQLERAVRARLRRQPFVDAGSVDVVVRGRIVPAEANRGWAVEIQLIDPGGQLLGTRTLSSEAPRCSALDDSLPLVVALMIDMPRDELPRPRPESSTAPATSGEPPWRPGVLALPEPQPGAASPLNLEPRLEIVTALGLTPELGLGLAAGALIEPPAFWAVDLEAAWWLPRSVDAGPSGSDFDLWTVGLQICPVEWKLGEGRLYGCAGQRVGILTVRGRGFAVNYEQSRIVYDVGLRARASLPLGRVLRLAAALGAELPLSRDRFFFATGDGRQRELFQQSSVILTGQAGVSLAFD